jgi:hypothetical protein
MSIIINKKTLSYNYNKINIDNVKIFNVNLSINYNIFEGAIFSGIFINNFIFIITDVHKLANFDFTNNDLIYKLNIANNYLNENIV